MHMISQLEEQMPAAVLDTVELLTKQVYDYIVSEDTEPAVETVIPQRRPLAYVSVPKPARSKTRPTALDPIRVRYNRRWFGAGALGAAGSLLAARVFGPKSVAGIAALGAMALAHMVLGEPAQPVLEHVTLRLPSLSPALDGLRIGQISDIHLGVLHTKRNLIWAVKQMQQERPDLIVLTGDQVMRRHAIPELPVILRDLQAPLGIYAISGNHDHWEGLRDVQSALEMCNIPMLMNEHRRLEWNGAQFWLLGTDDYWDGQHDLATALHGVPADGFKLLLAHEPDSADEAAEYGIDLQLSGHVHGGHLRLPLLGPFVRPRYGLRYLDGIYKVGGMAMYVSRGLGGAPLRLLCKPEATIITLRKA